MLLLHNSAVTGEADATIPVINAFLEADLQSWLMLGLISSLSFMHVLASFKLCHDMMPFNLYTYTLYSPSH